MSKALSLSHEDKIAAWLGVVVDGVLALLSLEDKIAALRCGEPGVSVSSR